MCLLAVVLNAPLSPLSVIHLRDERAERRAAPPCSHQRVLGGTDGSDGGDGAWFAFGRDTRVVVALTNVRAGSGGDMAGVLVSRGALVASVARGFGAASFAKCAAAVDAHPSRPLIDLGARYGAFNLVVARLTEGSAAVRGEAYHVTNVGWDSGSGGGEAFWVGGGDNGRWAHVTRLADGVHVVSNGAMDVVEGWPKVALVLQRVSAAAATPAVDTECAMQALAAALLSDRDRNSSVDEEVQAAWTGIVSTTPVGTPRTPRREEAVGGGQSGGVVFAAVAVAVAAEAEATAAAAEAEATAVAAEAEATAVAVSPCDYDGGDDAGGALSRRRLGPSPVAGHIEVALRASILVPHAVARVGFLSRVATAIVIPTTGPALFAWADVAAEHYGGDVAHCGWGALRVCSDCLCTEGGGGGGGGFNWIADGINWVGIWDREQ